MTDLSNLKILMLAPCLGKFGGIETFCLTLIEDLIRKGASVRLLRKKVTGFLDDETIQKTKTKSVHRGQMMKTNDLSANLFLPEILSSNKPYMSATSFISTTLWWKAYGMLVRLKKPV